MVIQYFLMLIVLLLVSGLAIDVGMLQWQQLGAQNAADAAAVEGMYQMARGDANWVTEAQAQAAVNGFANGSGNVTVSVVTPPTASIYNGNVMAVQATVTRQSIINIFMSLVNAPYSTVAGVAIAVEIPTCVWIMNSAGSTSSNSLALASAGMYPNCGVYVNTQSPGLNLGVDGFATLGASRIRVVGNAAQNTSSGTVYYRPKFGAAIKLDPLAYVTAPTIGSCTYNNKSLSSTTATLNPGTYCGGITLNAANVTLTSGLYIIAGGMSVTNNSTLNGTAGVTLYFTKTSAAPSYSNVTFDTSTLTLKAPTSSSGGAIKGVVIFADRNWVAHGSQGFSFNRTPTTFDGYWYSLNTGLYSWSSNMSYYIYNGLIVDNIYQFGSSFHLGNDNFAALGGVSPLHYEDGILVE